LAGRSARPTRGSTSSGRSTTSWSAAGREDRGDHDRRSAHPANWLGPIIDQRAVDRHQAAVSEARRDGTVFVGGERLTDAGMERGFYVEPTVVGNLPTSTGSSATSCSPRSRRSPPSTRSTRRSRSPTTRSTG
jgi:hypothetical protein